MTNQMADQQQQENNSFSPQPPKIVPLQKFDPRIQKKTYIYFTKLQN